MTLHSTVSLPISEASRGKLGDATLKRLCTLFEGVDYLFVDEIGMMSSEQLYWLDRRLQQICQVSEAFRGTSLVFFGTCHISSSPS